MDREYIWKSFLCISIALAIWALAWDNVQTNRIHGETARAAMKYGYEKDNIGRYGETHYIKKK